MTTSIISLFYSIFLLFNSNCLNDNYVSTEKFKNFYIKPCREIKPDFNEEKIMEMEKLFGVNKSIIPRFKLQTLIALSFYPELRNMNIEFRYKEISTTMQCQPTISSILKKNKHKYIININNKKNFKGVLIDDVPFNAQIGLIGHEIAHIVDFEEDNKRKFLNRCFDYLKEKTKKEYESYVDLLTIKSGLGWQLYDWAFFSLNNSISTTKYKDFKSKIYMTPELISREIDLMEIYN